MKIVAIGKKNNLIYFPYSDITIKNNTVEYFIYGQGHKKTKCFTILEGVEVPDRWSELSWLQICKIHELYGIHVSNMHASCKTAGIVSKQTILGYYSIYTKIKDLIPENFDGFFDYLSCDYMLSCFGMYSFDIVSFDKKMSQIDSDYNNVECTYKGNKCSLSEYITLKYGEVYRNIIDKLISCIV